MVNEYGRGVTIFYPAIILLKSVSDRDLNLRLAYMFKATF